MTGQIEWWVNTDPFDDWRRAGRAEVEALRGPKDACLAMLRGCDGEAVLRSGTIPVAGGKTVRLWPSPLPSPWTASVYTIQATDYAGVLREVETRLTEIDAMTAARLRDGVARMDPLELREALRAD